MASSSSSVTSSNSNCNYNYIFSGYSSPSSNSNSNSSSSNESSSVSICTKSGPASNVDPLTTTATADDAAVACFDAENNQSTAAEQNRRTSRQLRRQQPIATPLPQQQQQQQQQQLQQPQQPQSPQESLKGAADMANAINNAKNNAAVLNSLMTNQAAIGGAYESSTRATARICTSNERSAVADAADVDPDDDLDDDLDVDEGVDAMLMMSASSSMHLFGSAGGVSSGCASSPPPMIASLLRYDMASLSLSGGAGRNAANRACSAVNTPSLSSSAVVPQTPLCALLPPPLGFVADCESLQIKTKSIENTLIPLVKQISTLVNFKDYLRTPTTSSSSSSRPCSGSSMASSNRSSLYSERTMSALLRVGDTVSLAVEKFVSVGEAIAVENAAIKFDMLEACREARIAGQAIRVHTKFPSLYTSSPIGNSSSGCFEARNRKSCGDKFTMMQAANALLNAVTKMLLLADVVIINQILQAKNKVMLTLAKLEHVVDLQNFVQLFTQYGADLIELAHLSGERQNDLKDEKARSQMSSSRWILEKSTVMILSSSKSYLKHVECECARENMSSVFAFLQQALDALHQTIVDSGSMFDFARPSRDAAYRNSSGSNNNYRSTAIEHEVPFMLAFHQFEEALDLSRNNMITESNGSLVYDALGTLVDSTQDFTESLYINYEQRERIVRLRNEIRDQTLLYLRDEQNRAAAHTRNQQQQQQQQQSTNCNSPSMTTATASALTSNGHSQQQQQQQQQSPALSDASPVADTGLSSAACFNRILSDCEVLKKLLQSQTMQLANSLFRENQDASLLNCIRTYSLSNHFELLVETLDKFKEYADHVLEICRLLRHVAALDVFEVTCEHHFNVFERTAKIIQSASGAAALYPTCKSTTENLKLFCETWENQVNELSILVKEMQDMVSSGGVQSSKSSYLSLPRPGKHGTTSNRLSQVVNASKASRLDSNEQAKIAKLGLEMKLIQSEIEAEANKWNEPQNELVKLAKFMSDMAYEIHLFTRGDGPLRTTQDLFARADVFLQCGVSLYGTVREFLGQVPAGFLKDELVQLLEKLPTNFKQLKARLRQVTIGKTATFNKVDWVIKETRDFMNLVAKLVTNCFLCTTKYNICYEQCSGDELCAAATFCTERNAATPKAHVKISPAAVAAMRDLNNNNNSSPNCAPFNQQLLTQQPVVSLATLDLANGLSLLSSNRNSFHGGATTKSNYFTLENGNSCGRGVVNHHSVTSGALKRLHNSRHFGAGGVKASGSRAESCGPSSARAHSLQRTDWA